MSDLYYWLKQRQKHYIEELHRLIYLPSSIKVVPCNMTSKDSGWFFTPAEPNSADWSLARLKGNLNEAINSCGLFDDAQVQYLIDESIMVLPDIFELQGSIIWYESVNAANINFEQCCKILKDNRLELHYGNTEYGFSLYLIYNKSLRGYIKTIHYTDNCLEFYIEIQPDIRNRGLGTALLSLAVSYAHEKNKKLIYAVDAMNNQSQAIARKAGLKKFMRLNRFSKAINNLQAVSDL